MIMDWRAASKRLRSAMRLLYVPFGMVLLAATARPASAEFCRVMPDGRLMMSSGPFADDVDGPCPYYLSSQPQPQQAIQPAAPTMRFTTGAIGPFTTGEIGPLTTFSNAPPAVSRHR